MKDTVTEFRGATVRRKIIMFTGKRDASPRVDVTGLTLRNAANLPPHHKFPPPAITPVDAAQGVVEFLLTDEQTAEMAKGRVHPVRLAADMPNGDTASIGQFWIELL